MLIDSMEPYKKSVVEEMLKQCEGKSLSESGGAVMVAIMKLREKKMSFSEEETEALMSELTKDMTDSEKSRVEMMKQMINNI